MLVVEFGVEVTLYRLVFRLIDSFRCFCVYSECHRDDIVWAIKLCCECCSLFVVEGACVGMGVCLWLGLVVYVFLVFINKMLMCLVLSCFVCWL